MNLLNQADAEQVSGGIITTLTLNNETGAITFTNCFGPNIITVDDPSYTYLHEIYMKKYEQGMHVDGMVIYS